MIVRPPEEIIEYIRANPDQAEKYVDVLIETNFPFIVHTISQTTGRYVEVENSEELSIGLMAFNEAISKYDHSREAAFLSFARLVITSRIKDFMKKENRYKKSVSLDQITEEQGDQLALSQKSFENDISLEVEEWEKIINKFGFDLEDLAIDSPKHVDTRNNAVNLSEKISEDQEIVDHMYEKYRLPSTKIILRFRTTKKIVKRSRKFIIATVVILTKELDLLKQWIYPKGKRCSSC